MTCLHPHCPEPEAPDALWCNAHWSLVPGKLKTRYAYLLRKVQTCKTGDTKRLAKWHEQFVQAREDCRDAIWDALAERRTLG